MASGRCDQCGVEEYMPYVCKFCKGRYCAAHRLPENHGCAGLGAHRDRMRAEGRVFAPDPGAPLSPRVSATARAGASMDALWSKLDGKMTYVVMGACVGVFLVQVLLLASGPAGLMEYVFTLQGARDNPFLFVVQPWALLTSIFAHGDLMHLFLNMLVLLFFGQTVERLIGTRRFTWLFLGAGVVAGLAQVFLSTLLLREEHVAVLGASGAIQGIMGTLVVLAPTLTVLVFFVIPAPLWALTIFYVLYDILGAFTPGSRVANFAHLAGLAVGLAYGYHLRSKGLRARVQQSPPMGRQS